MDTASTPSSRTDERPPERTPARRDRAGATRSTSRPARPVPERWPIRRARSRPARSRGRDARRADHDAARRAFFRELGRSAITTVGQVAGLADVVGRGTTAAAAGLLGIDLREPPSTAPRPAVTSPARPVTRPAARPPTDDQYRSPYRVTEDTVVLLDQRAIPGCARGADLPTRHRRRVLPADRAPAAAVRSWRRSRPTGWR